MIPFNKPPLTGNEQKYVLEAMGSLKISGDGAFGKRCQKWFEERYGCKKTLLTPSCTHALEMAALLLEIKEGDEVIIIEPAYDSYAPAVELAGGKCVFFQMHPTQFSINAPAAIPTTSVQFLGRLLRSNTCAR